MPSSGILTCLTWVPAGVAQKVPQEAIKAKGEYQKFIQTYLPTQSKSQNEEQSNDSDNSLNCDPLSKYNLDTYDDDSPIFPGYDPEDEELKSEFDSEDEYDVYDKYCSEIKPEDNLLVVGHIEDNFGVISIYVYNDDENEFYCHHEIYIESPPFCIEWIGCDPSGNPGNFLAVGCLSSDILLYNIDLMDVLHPVAVLGKSQNIVPFGEDSLLEHTEHHSDAESKSTQHSKDGHDKEVVALSWNKTLKNILVSASADHQLFVWDIFTLKVLQKVIDNATFTSLSWHPNEPQILLCGNEIGKIYLIDCNIPEVPVLQWSITGEIQVIVWNCYDPNIIMCTSSRGYMHIYHTRKKTEICKVKCHDEDIPGLTLCENKTGKMLVTGGLDGIMAVWTLEQNPVLISTKNLNIGGILDIKSCPDHPSVVAIIGDKNDKSICIKKISDTASLTD